MYLSELNPRPICILLTDLHTATATVAPTDSMTEWPGWGHFDPAEERSRLWRLALPFLWVTAQRFPCVGPSISADAYMSRSRSRSIDQARKRNRRPRPRLRRCLHWEFAVQSTESTKRPQQSLPNNMY